MQKITYFLTLLLFTFLGRAQTIEGTYVALELISLKVDTSGKASFYMKDGFPQEGWFHEVKVVIKGNKITVDKSPVFFDNNGKKRYSASDGGFLSYKGTVSKSADLYIAKTKLTAHDYIGFSLFEPPKIVRDEEPIKDQPTSVNNATVVSKKPSVKQLRERHDVIKNFHGIEVFLPKGTVQKEYIIRPDKGGVWINNEFYHRVKSA